MARFYELTITDPSGEVWQVEQNGLGFSRQAASWGPTFSSLYTPWVCNSGNSPLIGKTNPSALNIEFDLPVAPMHTLQMNRAIVRIWGLGVRALGQAANLNPGTDAARGFKTFTLRAGMAQGLPLANPAQAGIIARGVIWQALGNWEDVNQTLDLILQNGNLGDANPAIVWNWKKGQPLSDALAQMVTQAFPGYTANINISQNIVAPSDQSGCYLDLNAFSKYLNEYSKRIGAQAAGPDYEGVWIVPVGNELNVLDGLVPARSVPLAFADLVGQPTWTGANTISFPTVLRGDIAIGDRVTFPKGVMPPYALTTPDAAFPGAPASSSTTFQGEFLVTEVHHYANFREPDVSAWSTVFMASFIPKNLI